jgi:hypothetical protein
LPKNHLGALLLSEINNIATASQISRGGKIV